MRIRFALVLAGALIGAGCETQNRQLLQQTKDATEQTTTRPVVIESESPARVFISRYGVGLSEAGTTPVTIQVPRPIIGFGLEIAFLDDSTRFEITPFALESWIGGKGKITIPAPVYGEPPTQDGAVQLVKGYLETTLIDPTTPLFKWGEFSKKVLLDDNRGPRYCWRMAFLLNSKNRLGGFTGWKNCHASFENGHLVYVFVPSL